MTMGDRIRTARRELKLSQAKLANLLKVSRPAVTQWEADATTPDPDNLRVLAEVLSKTTDWLLGQAVGNGGTSAVEKSPPPEGFRPPPAFFDERTGMPVYAGAEGGLGELIIHTDAIEYVPRPYVLAHVKDAFAIVVTGESMWPAFKPGERAWVNPLLMPARGDDCVLFAVDSVTGEERALIKEFVRGNHDEWVVRQYNPDQELRLPKLQWQRAYKVVGKFNR